MPIVLNGTVHHMLSACTSGLHLGVLLGKPRGLTFRLSISNQIRTPGLDTSSTEVVREPCAIGGTSMVPWSWWRTLEVAFAGFPHCVLNSLHLVHLSFLHPHPMPFLKGGRLAITRTRKYLESGRIILQDSVKVITIHHVPGKKISKGCDELIKWFLPPLQFKNPKVQILTLKNMCPTPFIQVFLNNQEELVIDCSYRTHVDINKHLNEVLGTSLHSTVSSTMDILNVNHPGNFGTKYQRQCICEVYGQVPCSSQVGRSGPWPGQEPQLPVVDGLTNQKGQDANEPKDSTA